MEPDETRERGAEEELFSEDIGERKSLWDYARAWGRNTLKNVGRRFGFLPYNRLTSAFIQPYDMVDEPGSYIGYPEIGRKYFNMFSKKLQEYYGSVHRILPNLGSNIRGVVIEKLPTYVALTIEKINENHYRIKPVILGKVYGAFDTETGFLYADPVNFREINDPEKALLKDSGLPVERADAVYTEELHHSAQQLAGGRIFREGRRKTEGEAALVRDEAVGYEAGAYASEKAEYMEENGRSIASFYSWNAMKDYVNKSIERIFSPFLPPPRPAYSSA